MNFQSENYRSFLKKEFEKRIEKNSRYSLRAFARLLGLDPRHLDGILKGKKGLSTEKAEDVANRLGCATHSKKFFLESVRAEDGRGKTERNLAKTQLEQLQENGILKKLQVELGQVELVSDWTGIAVHEYLKSHPYTSEKKLVAAFRETPERIQAALACLKELGLITQLSGKYSAQLVNLFSSDGIPSPALRNGHRSLLKKAETSLDHDPQDERDFYSLILNVEPQDMPAAKAMVRDFIDKFDHRFAKENPTSEVMSLALQFIPLSKTITKPKGDQS